MQQINSIQFIKEEEVFQMATASMEVTKQTIENKATGVKRDAYSASVRFNRLHMYKFNIQSDDYALLHYYSKRKVPANQFVVPVRTRIIETKWPEKDGRKAHSRFAIQVYVTDKLKWEFDITNTQFMNSFSAGLEEGELKDYEPVIKIPGKQDKEVINEVKEELKTRLCHAFQE